MPDLIAEMKNDLGHYPLRREFVILKKGWAYWAKGDQLTYYFEDHPELTGKLRILSNYGFIRDITYNNVARYVMTEEFVEFLIGQ
jgi:hypothetical protein